MTLEHERERTSRSARTDDGDACELLRVAGHEALAELLDPLLQADEVGIVTWEKHIIAVGDNHSMVTKDQPCQDTLRQG